jgi:hypothetical protein
MLHVTCSTVPEQDYPRSVDEDREHHKLTYLSLSKISLLMIEDLIKDICLNNLERDK